MPIWVYLYLAVIMLSSALAIAVNKKVAFYYVPGEILAVLVCLLVFLIRYEILRVEQSAPITVFATLYFLYWQFWENRHHYNFTGVQEQLAKDEDVGPEEAQVVTTQYTFLLALVITAYVSPVLYAAWSIVAAAGR